MGGFFEEADDELLRIAQEVIDEFHPMLRQARFGFVFQDKVPKRKGAKVLAAVSLVSPKIKVYLDFDYLVWVAKDEWDIMGDEDRVALLDHEFCHCCLNENFEWATRDHDVQEFVAIIERHGLWTGELRRMGDAVVQARLPFEERVPKGAVLAAPVSAFAGGIGNIS